MILKNLSNTSFKILLLSIFFTIGSVPSSAGWLCHEASSMREGRLLTTCGIGYGENEAKARSNALKTAYQELDAICDRSVDCKEQELFIEPLRNECLTEGKKFKCYRGISATITKKKRPAQKQKEEEARKEKIEIVIKNEEKESEKVTSYKCDYNYEKIETLLKKGKLSEAVLGIKEIPFREKCSEFHYKFMNTLSKLKKYPRAYISFLYSLLSTFEGDWTDQRPLYIFDYLYSMGPWEATGWKRIYLAVKSSSPRDFYRFSSLIFHLDTNDLSIQKERLTGLMTDIYNQSIGFPEKLSYEKAFSRLCYRADKPEYFWFLETLFKGEIQKIKSISRSKDILGCLKRHSKWLLNSNQSKITNTWFDLIFEKAEDQSELRDFGMDYISNIDREISRLDDTISEEEDKIKQMEKTRKEFKAILSKYSEKVFSKVEEKHRRNRVIEFCLKEDLRCKIIPTKSALLKRLKSKKNKTVEDATHYLTLMPKVSFEIKNELFDLLENHPHYKVRSNSMEALVNTPITEKEEIDILLKHSWKRVFDYGKLSKIMGKRLLVSLIPIAANDGHKDQGIAIEMLGLIGPDASPAIPALEKILVSKPHYSTVNRVKKALGLIQKK